MKCSTCKADNPDNKKFCSQCGTKLLCLCQQCGCEVLLTDKFCGECGQTLDGAAQTEKKEQTFDEKLSAIQKYLPGGLTEKILSQKGRIEGERRQVTVLFADMENFTPLVEKLGSEEAYALMDQVYEILIHKVLELEGTVNEMTGDGIMALFGAPIALEDAPQRAIRSALAIHQEIARFSDRLRRRNDLSPIKMRIGIHTGPVVVGTLGNDLRVEFKAVGDTVNLASRLQGLAEPGDTCVTGEVFKLTEGLFHFECLGSRTVKGRKEPLRIYRVIRPGSVRTRFEAGVERGLTPLMGRVRELEALREGLHRAEQGRGQVFTITGEPGVGKSRVLYEFLNEAAAGNIGLMEGRCLSYGTNAAYHPIADVLRSAFQVSEADPDFLVREKVRKGLEALELDESHIYPVTLELLGLRGGGIGGNVMAPEGKKDQITETLKQLVSRSAESRTLLLAIEDVHWADPGTVDVLKLLVDGVPASRCLMLLTCRPEFEAPWSGKSYHNHLTVSRLPDRECAAMAGDLLGTGKLAPDIQALVLDKTEGVPFFIEEFIKSLKDLGILREDKGTFHLAKDFQDPTIPSSIHDMIMARVDALPGKSRELIQTGSIIDREFSYQLIKMATGMDDLELAEAIARLKDSELLYERGLPPKSTYVFRHALTRDVVYDSILNTRKKKFHLRIGTLLESMHREKLESHAELLAHHFRRGGGLRKASDYFRLAARAAERGGDLSTAILHCEQRITCLEGISFGEDFAEEIVDARTMHGLYNFQLFHFNEAKRAVAPIVAQAQARGLKKRVCQIGIIEGAHALWVEEDYSRATASLLTACAMAEEMADVPAVFFSQAWLGFACLNQCNFEESLSFFQRALEINVSAGNTWGTSVVKSTISSVNNEWNDVKEGFKCSSEALGYARLSKDTYTNAIANNAHGFSLFMQGCLEESEKLIRKGLELSERMRFHAGVIHSHSLLGGLYLEKSDWEIAAAHFEEAARIARTNRIFPSQTIRSEIAGALALSKKGGRIDIEELNRSLAENKMPLQAGTCKWLMAEIHLSVDEDPAAAEAVIAQAIEENECNRTMWSLGRSWLTGAEIFFRKQDHRRAHAALDRASSVFRGCGADGWAEKAERRKAQ